LTTEKPVFEISDKHHVTDSEEDFHALFPVIYPGHGKNDTDIDKREPSEIFCDGFVAEEVEKQFMTL